MTRHGARSMLHLACLCALATAAFAPARAQDEPATSAETDAAEAEAATALDTIVVTGTRIPRTGFDTLEPAFVIDEQKIKDRGLTNIADILNETPGFGFGVTPEGGQSTFGVAVNFVNRFGLGTNRTLTLINGRRAVSSNTPSIFGPAGPGLQVDLNIIPALMVDRIENIAIGGAPTYGSDAIAGVVNVILKRDYEGIETTGTYALTDEGDGERWNAGAIGGWNFPDDVANVTLAVNYDKVDGVLQTERERFARGLSFQPNPLAPAIFTQQPGRTPQNDGRLNPGISFNTGNTDGIPNSVLIPNSRFFAFSTGGLVLPTGATNLAGGALRGFGPNSNVYLQFDRSGNLVPYAPGTNFGTLNSSGGDGWNIVDTGQLSSDLERRSVNFSGRYLIGDRAEFFIEGLYYDSDALEIIDQSIFNTPNFGGFSAALVIPVDYAQLSEAARAQLRALGVSSFRLSRASSDLVNNNGRSETQVYRSVLGFSGDFDLFERLFNWELTANWGRNDSEFFQTVLNQQNFTNALHVVRDAQGRLVCSPTRVTGLIVPNGTATGQAPMADPRCVPLDIFGEDRASAAARAYVTGVTRTETVIEQRMLNANIGGSVFDTWAGPVQFNVGFEHREEEGEFLPNAFQQQALGRAVAILPNQGEFETDEWFAEAVLPLIKGDWDFPLLHRFDLTGKFRTVDNTVNGSFDTYTYGFQYRPISTLEFRGNRTKSLRAPAITELFTPVSNIFTLVPDPCDARNVNGGTRPSVRLANCQAFYRQFNIANPAVFQSVAVSATIPGTLGGDPNLDNEVAHAETIGVVWQPEELLPGLRIALDYYAIEVDDVIGNLNATAVAEGCFDNTNFETGDVNNANAFCQRISRDSNGQITGIRTGFVNGGFLDFTGQSLDLQYSRDLGELGFGMKGRIELAANLFRLRRLEDSLNNVVTDNDLREISNPKRQYQYGVGYTLDPIAIGFQANYQSGVIFDNTFTTETRDILELESQWTYDANLAWRFHDQGMLRFTVTNLTDEDPPFPLATLALGVYDTLGRRYSLALDWRW